MLTQIFAYTKSITLSLVMTRHILLLVVFLSFLGVVLAQDKTLTVQVIIDDEQEEHPGSVYVTNSRINQTKVTDSDGILSLDVQIGDEIIFMSDFYESRRLFITETLINKPIIEVHLNTKFVLLDEAKLGDFRLTGDLRTDAKNAKFVDSAAIVYANLGIKEKDVPKPNPAGQRVGKFKVVDVLTLNMTKVIGELNGYNNRQRKTHAYEDKQKILNKIRDLWQEDFYVNHLKIPQEKIDEFVFFSYESSDIYNKIKMNDLLTAEKILMERSQIYLERLNKTATGP